MESCYVHCKWSIRFLRLSLLWPGNRGVIYSINSITASPRIEIEIQIRVNTEVSVKCTWYSYYSIIVLIVDRGFSI